MKYVIGIILSLVVIIILQNLQPVDTKILFLTLTMPRAVLLFLTTVAGFIIGVVFTVLLKRHR